MEHNTLGDTENSEIIARSTFVNTNLLDSDTNIAGDIQENINASTLEEYLESVDCQHHNDQYSTIEEEAAVFRVFHGEEDDVDELMNETTTQDDVVTYGTITLGRDESNLSSNENNLLLDDSSNAIEGELSVSECTKSLNGALEDRNQSMYSRKAALLQIPEEDYSEEKLGEMVNFAKTFTAYSATVGTSSVIVSTAHCIEEGNVYLKVQDIDYAVNGRGFKKRLPRLFPGIAESTIYARMAIAKIEGGSNWLPAGSERLRRLARAIKKAKVSGPDQIAELIKYCGIEIDLNSMDYGEINSLLDAVIETTLTKLAGSSGGSKTDPEVTIADEDLGESGSATETNNVGEVFGNSETCEETNPKDESSTDAKSDIGNATMGKGVGDSEINLETDTEVDGSSDSKTATETITADEGSDGLVNDTEITDENEGSGEGTIHPGGTQKPHVKRDGSENENKETLKEDSVNHILANFNSSVRGLLKLAPPKEAFDLKLIEDAKKLLGELESFVKVEREN